MTIECPKCQHENHDDSAFCAKCGTKIDVDIGPTKTIETPKEELKRGTLFAGRYEIIEELGKGGMGKVYRVEDIKIKKEIALKLIKPEIASDKKTIERFKNELTTARDIRHKNVCGMFDLGEEKELHYITMEYISGQDLKGLIRQSAPLSVPRAISITKQICDGLSEAHSRGIVHRDLKPNNIMIDQGGNAKIMDFGIAKALKGKSITGSGVMIGTPQYMSPEQVEGKEVDQRSDIYSLGIILYEMLTTQVPFEGNTPLTIGVKQKTEAPRDPRELNERIPDDLSRLILKCLAKDREDRYQSAEEVISDLKKLEQGLPTTARVVPKKRPLTSREITVQFSLKKAFIPALAIAVMAVAILVVWSPWEKKTPSFIASDRPSLAILYFRNGSGDQSLDNLRENLCDYLITDISQSKFIHVLDSSLIMSLLERHDLLVANRYSADDLQSIATAGGVTHILTGSYTRPGEFIRIDYTLHDFRKDGEVSSDRMEGREGEDITLLVDRLTRSIKAKLDLTQAEIDSDTDNEIGIILTAKPEAYKRYREGLDFFNKGYWRESIPAFQEAVAIDPQFAMAYRKLGSVYLNLNEPQKANEYTQLAMDNIDRLSYLEQMIIKARTLEGGINARIEWWENLYRDYPENAFVNGALGSVYSEIEEWDHAIEHIEIARKFGSEFVWDYIRLGTAYCAKKMYSKASEVFQDYIDNFGDSADMLFYIFITHAIEGYYEQALGAIDKAIELDPGTIKDFIKATIPHLRGNFEEAEKVYISMLEEERPEYKFQGRRWLEILYRTLGQYEEANNIAEAGLKYAEENNNNDWKRTFTLVLAVHELETGDLDRAFERAETYLTIGLQDDLPGSIINANWLKTEVHLRRNEVKKAVPLVEELKTYVDSTPNIKDAHWYYMNLGLIEIKRQNYSQAIDLITQAYEMRGGQRTWIEPHAWILFNLATAYELSGDIEAAKKEYENILALTTGRLWWGDLYVKSYYQLGKIHEELGNKSKAIEHYEKFLDLWKNADPGLPEVDDAKKRLAGLKNQ